MRFRLNGKKHMQTNHVTKVSLKNPMIVFSLISFSILTSSAATGISATAAQPSAIQADTIKITAGVPLKPEDISPLLTGERIPVLSLPRSSGEVFDLNKSVAETPTILVFYRGSWCPYCTLQLSGLQEIENDLKDLGYQIIAISTDSPGNLSKTMSKEKLSYTLLSDADLKAAKRFGIAYKSPGNYDRFLPETSGGKNLEKLLPVPSVFILNKKGTILFEYINPDITQRLSAPLLKAAAAALRDDASNI